ncbi:MAG: hypothetical protein QXM56_00505, partial [Acidilobaceae archaeon]
MMPMGLGMITKGRMALMPKRIKRMDQLKKILEELNPEVAYVLFNNVYSFEDALRFKKLLLSY